MSMLERAYNALIAAGVDARLATRHAGLCTAPYCVVYEGDATLGRSIAIRHVLVDLFAPAATPELLLRRLPAILAAMREAGFQGGFASPTIALEDYRAVSATLDFTALCAI